MKILRIFLFSVFIMLGISQMVSAAEYPWELKKDEDGIQAFVRKVEGSSILEYKGVVTVDASLEDAVSFFEDDTRTTEWFHNCTEFRVLKAESPDQKILYSVIEMPWPVSDRDVVFRRIRTKDAVTGVVRYENSALPEDYPEQKGKVRMPYLKGSWSFVPHPGGGTEITYQEHSEVGGHIPDWLVNKLAVNIPFNSLAHFRELLLTKPDVVFKETATDS